jgi:hypothetical protein
MKADAPTDSLVGASIVLRVFLIEGMLKNVV